MSVRLLVDTNVLIDHLRGDLRSTEALRLIEIGVHRGFLSTMNEYELLAVREIRPVRWVQVSRLLKLFQIIPVTSSVAHRAADFRRRYRTPDGDAIIAATAVLLGVTLVTRNLKHFVGIAELHVTSLPLYQGS